MWLKSKTSGLFDAALALAYPQPCRASCGGHVEARSDGVACAACWAATRIFRADEQLCWKCGLPAPGQIPPEHKSEAFCHRCAEEHFTAARACGAYDKALRASALALKKEAHVAPRLARLLLETQRRTPLDRATRILPIPLHPLRLRERGFNQAAVLGRSLSRLTSLPFDEWSLVRHLHTERHRAGMDARARRESVAGAFAVERPRLVAGERVLLVDDVYTTGATASACAQALMEAGALEVFVLTVARPIE
jgi:ComF family protein